MLVQRKLPELHRLADHRDVAPETLHSGHSAICHPAVTLPLLENKNIFGHFCGLTILMLRYYFNNISAANKDFHSQSIILLKLGLKRIITHYFIGQRIFDGLIE